jgi:uncharacterized membrane protein
MGGAFEGMEHTFQLLLQWLRLAVEATAALWIAVGFVYAFAELVGAHVHRQVAAYRTIRLRFSRYLSLALEFQLAADILSTAIAPTYHELAILGITAVIRTGLNYFLSKEMQEEVAEHAPGTRDVLDAARREKVPLAAVSHVQA